MTTYDAAAVADAVIAHKKGITLQQGRALRDNPIAIAEGASGAPRVDAIAAMSHQGVEGAVGTYTFARRTSGTATVGFGTTLAGSSLSPTAAATRRTGGGFTDPWDLSNGSALSGTWRCMGRAQYSFVGTATDSGKTMFGATLWLRIS